jgi:hypothetical protein
MSAPLSARSERPERDPFEGSLEHACELELHGVRLRFCANRADLAAYVPAHLGGFEAVGPGAPQIEIRVLWIDEDDYDPKRHAFGGLAALDPLGKRMFEGPDELVWLEVLTAKRLELRFRLEGERLRMDALVRFESSKKGSSRRDPARAREYFRSMIHLVYYPLAWYLEHFRGLYLLHASAIELDGQAFLFGGVAGVGKSTTSVALLCRTGAGFLAESLVFHDGHEIHGCYEPIRMGEHSLGLLGETGEALVEADLTARSKRKRTFHVIPSRRVASAPVGAIFLPRFGRPAGLRRLDPEASLDRLLAINTQSRKVNDYVYFASALEMKWPRPGRAAGRIARLDSLLRNAALYELDLDPEAGLEPAVECVLAARGGR